MKNSAHRHGFAPIILVLVFGVVLLGAVGLGYLVLHKNIAVPVPVNEPIQKSPAQATKNPSPSLINTQKDTWKTFSDPKFPFTFKYPNDWALDTKYSEVADFQGITSNVRVSFPSGGSADYEFIIAEIGPIPAMARNSSGKTAAFYAFKQWSDYEDQEAELCRIAKIKSGRAVCLPRTPGFIEFPISMDTIFSLNESIRDSVEVGCYGCKGDVSETKSYIIAGEKNLYKAYLTGPVTNAQESNVNVLVDIVTSLKIE